MEYPKSRVQLGEVSHDIYYRALRF
jgi:hypothetical protein